MMGCNGGRRLEGPFTRALMEGLRSPEVAEKAASPEPVMTKIFVMPSVTLDDAIEQTQAALDQLKALKSLLSR